MPTSRFVLASATLAVASSLLAPNAATAASRDFTTLTSKTVSASVDHGVYAGPGADGVTGAAEWSTFTGRKTTRVIDFLADESWSAITNTGWLLSEYQGKGLHLDLGIPMLPKDNSGTLAQCATGAYDAHWKKIGTDLVKYGQGNATLRIGWEMNGSWYKWSAAQNPTAWVGCYQRVVKATRTAAGSTFSYTWTVNVGVNQSRAETVYPGDGYVDYVGVNSYDMNWNWYPTPYGTSTVTARANAWRDLKTGDHGLDYWVKFASAHGKRLAIPEWGVVSRADGHGGKDNPDYINAMLDFTSDPANNVAYACYFNDNNTTNSHMLTGTSAFPEAASALQARLSSTAAQPSTSESRKRSMNLMTGSARAFARTALK